MLLYCHDPECPGAETPEDAEPVDTCRHCSKPLMDEHECVIAAQSPLDESPAVPIEETSLTALSVCKLVGSHVYEGRFLVSAKARMLIGRCSRCGLGIREILET